MTLTKTYRFKFNEEITSILNQFSKLHMHDDKYLQSSIGSYGFLENIDIIKEESRLIEAGYDGDINDKLYKSARYYYRKKTQKKDQQKQKRREYVCVSGEF